MKEFYYVLNPDGRLPRVRHESYTEALKEAERLANYEGVKELIVLKAMARVSVERKVTTQETDQARATKVLEEAEFFKEVPF